MMDVIVDKNFDAEKTKLLVSKDDGKTWEKVNIIVKSKDESSKGLPLSQKARQLKFPGKDDNGWGYSIRDVQEALKELIEWLEQNYNNEKILDEVLVKKAKEIFGEKFI